MVSLNGSYLIRLNELDEIGSSMGLLLTPYKDFGAKDITQNCLYLCR